ncbi:S24 family peptidase [Sphingobacterium sp. CZ-2]|uniref:S24 family peptidase n=1 Tax=Sphingobacterium sp. CZ-2 TaxID=2557994 RepID=UPI00106FCD54|nr:S24 family peptidase [Sphingobacterium sp. CZ-2]QBR12795.1 helix-turn-helix transcriptional regulator [Sphingobacterium sp. CZ-2]
MNNWDRLEQVIQYLGLNVNSFAKEIGLSRAERLYQIKKGNYAISKNLAGIITERFPDINEAWLLTGEGTMGKEVEPITNTKIPLFNISLDAFDTDLSNMPVAYELEIPLLSGSDFAFVNQGEAMQPEIEHGSVVFVKEVDKDAVVFGDIYLIISEKMNVVRFVRGGNDKQWRLLAKNVEGYDELFLDPDHVKAIYKVKGVLSMVSL